MSGHHVFSMVSLRYSICGAAPYVKFHDHHRSFSVLGMAPGIIVTIAVAASVQYTSLVLWKYCLKHSEIRDVCDIGKKLFGGSQIAYNITAVFFILNNTFIQGIIFTPRSIFLSMIRLYPKLFTV